jgi:hypothetical protein
LARTPSGAEARSRKGASMAEYVLWALIVGSVRPEAIVSWWWWWWIWVSWMGGVGKALERK